jgi:hypothetical protein
MQTSSRRIALATVGLSAAPVLCVVVGIVLCVVLGFQLGQRLGWLRPAAPRAEVAMAQSAYVWQRAWNGPVQHAVEAHALEFDAGLVALGAEIAWKDGAPQHVTVDLDHALLARGRGGAGVALRIGPCPKALLAEPDTIAYIVGVARTVLASARADGWEPTELQLDFDSATSRLADYRRWVERIAAEVHPTPVTITVLPTWMSSGEFGPLVDATDGFVLQVHSVEKAAIESDAPTLCDAASAIAWTERAAHYGKPFRVALPTYGYIAVFADDGSLKGLVAEAGSALLETGARVREVRAEAGAMAELVAQWSRARPAAMQGIVWYRLPVEGDRLNWSWPTLARVMRGEEPRPALRTEVAQRADGLAEIVCVNEGDAEATMPRRIEVSWSPERALLAGDGLAGMEWSRGQEGSARFVRVVDGPSARVRPDERRLLGWIRLDGRSEVVAHESADEAE